MRAKITNPWSMVKVALAIWAAMWKHFDATEGAIADEPDSFVVVEGEGKGIKLVWSTPDGGGMDELALHVYGDGTDPTTHFEFSSDVRDTMGMLRSGLRVVGSATRYDGTSVIGRPPDGEYVIEEVQRLEINDATPRRKPDDAP